MIFTAPVSDILLVKAVEGSLGLLRAVDRWQISHAQSTFLLFQRCRFTEDLASEIAVRCTATAMLD